MNRLPIPIRVICFILGLAATYLVVWSRPEFLNLSMALATNIAMGGAAVMMLGMAFWSGTENPWFIKLMLIGTAIMGLGEGLKPFPSFPCFLFFTSLALGLAVLCTPKRHFSS